MFPVLRGILDTFPVHVDDATVIFVQNLDKHIKIDLEPFFCGLLQPSSEVLMPVGAVIEDSHEVVNVTDINNNKEEIPVD